MKTRFNPFSDSVNQRPQMARTVVDGQDGTTLNPPGRPEKNTNHRVKQRELSQIRPIHSKFTLKSFSF